MTIFGESGGGAKVSVLMAMPPAKGLFHKAIIQSGPAVQMANREDGTRTARQMLEHLGLEVSRLLRTRYGPFQLFDLPRGQAAEIRQTEVERFRRALLGGNLGAAAARNGWAGVVIDGCVRDVAELAVCNVGIRALACIPLPTERRTEGLRDLAVQIQGVWVRPGDWLYADEDGIVVSNVQLAG